MNEYKIDLDSAADLDENSIMPYNQFLMDTLPDYATYIESDGKTKIVGPVEKIYEWNRFKIGEQVSVSYSHVNNVIDYFFRREIDNVLCVRWRTPDNNWSYDRVDVIRPLGKGREGGEAQYDVAWNWEEHG